ncbi:MAG: magnesium protoporphyrin IX methyltransferase, partial [Betaproteobacteria bacterium]|nr:magnesium protoporphyrin IX methyltransferase [Betaproteobacteria bacterium]
AGCGTGAMACELARRGAEVVAIDLSPTLVDLARERSHADPHAHRIQFIAGDMLADSLGQFDHVVAMDSLIHYDADDMANAVQRLSDRTRLSLHLSFAPRTPMLALMHAVGRCLPRADRAPSIVPLAAEHIISKLASLDPSRPNMIALGERVSSGFYISQLLHVLQAQQLQAEQACDQAQALRLS